MSKKNKEFSTECLKIIFLVFATFTCLQHKSFSGTIAQAPLFISGADIDPNIMFVLDDSGSMQFEFMPANFVIPDTAIDWIYYLFPTVNRVYGGDIYESFISDHQDDNLFNYFLRSSENNKVFYNPDITYQPWVNSDGTPMADANPKSAYYNPVSTIRGSVNLISKNEESAFWIYNIVNQDLKEYWIYDYYQKTKQSYWPISYYNYKGEGAKTRRNSYARVQITSSTPSTAIFTSPGGISRTRDEEIQNFANWFQYYRSRILAARAGIGRAFAAQEDSVRVGFGAINKAETRVDRVSTTTIISGVRPFSGSNRVNFFSTLYGHTVEPVGTPLRRALDAAGQYYARSDNRGPCSTSPGQTGGDDIACRQNYTVLMTDGYWNDASAVTDDAQKDVDSLAGELIVNPDSSDSNFQYTPAAPYKDGWSNTLADVAMYYWNRDLRSDLENNVPITAADEAFWQHMVTFGVGLGVSGLLTPETDLPALVAGTKTWPEPSEDGGAANVDDLWHAAVNSRGGFFSAADPDAFANRLSETLQSIVDRSVGTASSIAANSTQLIDGTLIYQAKFDSRDWSGRLLAYTLDTATGEVSEVRWDTDASGKILPHANRRIYTWNGNEGVVFAVSAWADLSRAEQKALQNRGSVTKGKDRMNWIRGDQSNEEDKTRGYLRKRNKLLGDMVHSNPLVVGSTNFNYQYLPAGTPGADTYQAFQIANKTRRRMLYVGSNDGMLHGFDVLTGEEQFAYVPQGVFANLAYLTDPSYTHRFFVDGSSSVGDAYIDEEWKTILIGALAGGGRSIFALDITDPDSFDEDKVLWEFSDPDLGNTFSEAVIGRTQNGQWVAIFGNGYGSDNHKSVLFVVNLADGTLIKKIDTGVGRSTSPNGLSTPALLADGKRTLTYAYAGDLQGNLWKFDLNDANKNKWGSAFSEKVRGVTSNVPLFKARGPLGLAQPITAPLEIGKHDSDGYMIYFGTGKYFETGDNQVGTSPPVQSFYGIQDNDAVIDEVDRSTLLKQEILAEILDYKDHDWRITSAKSKADMVGKRGWYLDLVSPLAGAAGERVISVPLLRWGRVVFVTLIPSQNPCVGGGFSWLMELEALTGNRPPYSVLDVDGDGDIDGEDVVAWHNDGENVTDKTSGRKTDGIIDTPAVVGGDKYENKYAGDSSGDVVRFKVPAGGGDNSSGRRSWRQVR